MAGRGDNVEEILKRLIGMDRLLYLGQFIGPEFERTWGKSRDTVRRDRELLAKLGQRMDWRKQPGPDHVTMWFYLPGQRPFFTQNEGTPGGAESPSGAGSTHLELLTG